MCVNTEDPLSPRRALGPQIMRNWSTTTVSPALDRGSQSCMGCSDTSACQKHQSQPKEAFPEEVTFQEVTEG